MIIFNDKLLTSLSSAGFGTRGLNLFLNTMPSTPLTCTAIINQGGFSLVKDPIRRPAIQIIHRNTHANSGLTYVSSIYDYLHGQFCRLEKLEGRFEAQHQPGVYSRDQNNYTIYSQNFVFVTSRQKL